MENTINTSHIGTVLVSPAFSEMRFVIVSDEKEFRGYISGDGEKLFECCDNTAESVFLELSEWCERIINE